jgi:hypothetical protein
MRIAEKKFQQCKKCGYNFVSVEWRDKNHWECADHTTSEHFDIECQQCHFKWYEYLDN